MPGGVVVNPPRAVQETVKRTVPAFPIHLFNMVASMYHTEKDHRADTPGSVRKQMEKISRKAFDLSTELSTLSEEATDALFEGCMKFGIGNPHSFKQVLDLIADVARSAEIERMHLKGGAPSGAVHKLVSRLIGISESYGISIDARPRGDLVFLVQSVLDSYPTSNCESRKVDNESAALKAVQRYLDRMASDNS